MPIQTTTKYPSKVKSIRIASPGLRDELKFKEELKESGYSYQEAKTLFFIYERIRKSFEQREKNWEYFDGLPYYSDYILLRQASNTYLRPKKNDDEVRVNTGTTEKKIEVIYNELLALNLEPGIRGYDEYDNLIQDLGDQFSAIVLRTNEIEKDDDMWSEAILELLTQRGVFLEENWEVEVVRDKESPDKKRFTRKARKRLMSGLQVFLGDITIPWYEFNRQPYVVNYERVHWKEAERRFKYNEDGKENANWKKVSRGSSGNATSAFGLRFGILGDDEVEIITYKSYPDDEYMRICQGYPMDKVGRSLPWKYEGYNMRMFGLKSMARRFAYLKPLTASAKTLQSLDNESVRMVIRKWRQALEPPMGTKAGKVFSKDIWSPAAMTQGLTKDDFEILINHQGVTNSDMAMLNFIKEKTEEFIGAGNIQQGLGQEGQQTATEIRELQKQFITLLGLAVLAVMAMKREMTYLRLFNLLEHIKIPTGKRIDPLNEKMVNAYQQFAKDDIDLGNGRRGVKKMMFMDRDLTEGEEEKINEEEEELSKIGQHVRYFSINIKKLYEVSINWFVVVSQSLKESDALDKVMFRDALEQAAIVSQVAGRPISGDNVIDDYERTWKKKNWFEKEAPINPEFQSFGKNSKESNVAGQMTPDKTPKPGVNALREKTR